MSNETRTRRERRAAERAAGRAAPRATVPANGLDRRPSDTTLLTAGAIAAGVILVAVMLLINGQKSANGPANASYVIPPAPAAALMHDHSLGDPAAPVKIDLWADFQCPICDQFYTDIEPRLRSTFITTGVLQVTYHDLAFLGPESKDAAIASRVSEAIGPGFWPYHDALYANQGTENSGTFSRPHLADIAVALGMDRQAFLTAMDDPTYAAAVQAQAALGSSLGIDSTPTLVIAGQIYSGLPDWTQLSALIEQLASAAPSP